MSETMPPPGPVALAARATDPASAEALRRAVEHARWLVEDTERMLERARHALAAASELMAEHKVSAGAGSR